MARFGVPHTVTTDRGTQFTGAIWRCMCNTLKIKHITTTSNHPQSNGLVERVHRQMKESLRARNAGAAWLEHVPWVLLGIRTAPKEDSGVSSSEAVYGSPLVLPGQLQHPDGQPPPTCHVPPIPTRARTYAQAVRSGSGMLDGADLVFVPRGQGGGPLAQSYAGPYRVLERTDKCFKLRVGNRVETVSADRLKPYRGSEVQDEASPPRRGRPPGSGGNG